jgi:hypothetical protein
MIGTKALFDGNSAEARSLGEAAHCRFGKAKDAADLNSPGHGKKSFSSLDFGCGTPLTIWSRREGPVWVEAPRPGRGRRVGTRRIFLVAASSGEGLLTERRTAAQPWRRELALMPETVGKRVG